MPTVAKTAIVAASAPDMFRIVEDCGSYPEFLPWCSRAEVFERTPALTRARLDIDYHGLASHISTINRMQEPERIDLEFVEGPFDHFHGHWRFRPLGGEGCRVDFTLDYELASAAIEKLLGPVFGHIIETLVERFVARAERR